MPPGRRRHHPFSLASATPKSPPATLAETVEDSSRAWHRSIKVHKNKQGNISPQLLGRLQLPTRKEMLSAELGRPCLALKDKQTVQTRQEERMVFSDKRERHEEESSPRLYWLDPTTSRGKTWMDRSLRYLLLLG